MLTTLKRLTPSIRFMDNDMNTPPNPPSPADEDTRRRIAAQLRKRLVTQLHKTFPGLPY